MPDVFEVLGAEHAEIKRMLAALEGSPDNSAGATEAIVAARKAVAERLIMDASAHEEAEEEYFWPTVRERVPGGSDLADQAIAQETEAKEVLAKLGTVGGSDPAFDALISSFIPDSRAHIEFEETRVWPALRMALSRDESEELGTKIMNASEHGTTRPHPRRPPTPAVLAAGSSDG